VLSWRAVLPLVVIAGMPAYAQRVTVRSPTGDRQFTLGRRLNAGPETGATSEVYAAREVGTNRKVTVKLLRKERAHEEDLRESFVREHEALLGAMRIAEQRGEPRSKLHETFGLGTYDGRPFLVMEHVKGRPLGPAWAPFGKRYSFRASAQIASDVLDGLEALHLQGKKHNDAQPGNVMVSHGRAQLIDLGTASAVDTEFRGYHPSYSPAYGKGATVDLFAVGGLLYAMQTGKQPPADFDSVPTERRRMKVAGLLGMDPHQPREFDFTRVARPLRPIILKAMDPDPAKGFQSAAEFKAALAAALRSRASSR
jgi:serine/threonine protein kinase